MELVKSILLMMIFLIITPVIVMAADPMQGSVPLTNNQEVVVQWGQWVGLGLSALQQAALAIIPTIVAVVMTYLAVQFPWLSLFIPRERVNEAITNAVKSAISGVNGASVGKKLTIPVTNDIVRQAIIYLIAQVPGMVRMLGDNLPALVQKIMARLPDHATVPAGYTTDGAIKDVSLKSIEDKAKEQDVSISDQIKKQLGG